jgi:hypothetical protein
LTGTLRDAGPIPDRTGNQLLISGAAVGSFGFDLVLPCPEQDLFSLPDEAVRKIETVLRLSAGGSDDDMAEVIADMPLRAVKNIYLFLSVLEQYEAWCALEFGDVFFRYSDYEQLKYSAKRLGDENIAEREETYHGEFQGVLPNALTFEFKLFGQDAIIRGKIDRAIGDPDVLNRQWLHKNTSLRVHVLQLGNGKPRYTLQSLKNVT